MYLNKNRANFLSIFMKSTCFTERAVSAVMGAAVADAATRPLHWIYRSAALYIYFFLKSYPKILDIIK